MNLSQLSGRYPALPVIARTARRPASPLAFSGNGKPKEAENWGRHPWYLWFTRNRYKLALTPLLLVPIQAAWTGGSAGLPIEHQKAPHGVVDMVEKGVPLTATDEKGQTMVLDSPYAAMLLRLLLVMMGEGAFRLWFELKAKKPEERKAYHQAGHLLAGVQGNLPSQEIGCKTVRLDCDRKELFSVERVRERLIQSHAGKVMENLVYGYDVPHFSDRFQRCRVLLSGLSVQLMYNHSAKNAWAIVRFAPTAGRKAEEFLLCFDRKEINTLAEYLENEKDLDPDKLARMVNEQFLNRKPPGPSRTEDS